MMYSSDTVEVSTWPCCQTTGLIGVCLQGLTHYWDAKYNILQICAGIRAACGTSGLRRDEARQKELVLVWTSCCSSPNNCNVGWRQQLWPSQDE